jgi:hypothetical protein
MRSLPVIVSFGDGCVDGGGGGDGVRLHALVVARRQMRIHTCDT